MQHSFEKRAANHHENAFYLQKRVRGERVPWDAPVFLEFSLEKPKFCLPLNENLFFPKKIQKKKKCPKQKKVSLFIVESRRGRQNFFFIFVNLIPERRKKSSASGRAKLGLRPRFARNKEKSSN